MQYEVTFAGFGGQGVLAIGQILAMAAMEAGKQVVWLPSYGPEMRGGTANCTVVISDRAIGSPIVSSTACAVVMNRPSFDKFESKIRSKGLLIINSSMIDIRSEREDLDQLLVPANDLAVEGGNPKSANLVILGAFAARTVILDPVLVRKAVEEKLGGKKGNLAGNLALFDRGMELARSAAAA